MEKQAQDAMAKLLVKEMSLETKVRAPYQIHQVETQLKAVQDAGKTSLNGWWGRLWRKTKLVPLERKMEALKSLLERLKGDYLVGAYLVPLTLEEHFLVLQKCGMVQSMMEMEGLHLPQDNDVQKAQKVSTDIATRLYQQLRFVHASVKRKTPEGWARYFKEEELTTLDPWLVRDLFDLYQNKVALNNEEIKN